TEKTTDVAIAMKLGATTEAITVTGEVPIVDKTNVSANTRLREKEFQKLPLGRDYQTLFNEAAGVEGGPGQSANPNTHGALDGNNLYLFDGTDVTDSVTGTFGANLNYEAIQEVSVNTAGLSAEYGRAVGGVITVITKSGTNTPEGSLKLLLSNDQWNSQNKTHNQVTGESLARTKFDHVNPTYSGTLGGPILRDRAWFFGA